MPEFCGTSVDSGKLTSLAETWTAWRCVSYEQWRFILIRRYVLKTPWLLVFVGYIFWLQLLATATWIMHSWTNITFWTSRVEASFTIIKSRFIHILLWKFSYIHALFESGLYLWRYFYFSLESHPLHRIQGFRARGCEDFRCFSVFVGKITGIKATQPTQPTQGTPIC